MSNQLDQLRNIVTDLREAVMQQDIIRIHDDTQRISSAVSELSKLSPDNLSDDERMMVLHVMELTRETNKLLIQQLDFTKLVIDDFAHKRRTKQGWYA